MSLAVFALVADSLRALRGVRKLQNMTPAKRPPVDIIDLTGSDDDSADTTPAKKLKPQVRCSGIVCRACAALTSEKCAIY
jgi:hypothetical protein